MEIISWWHQTTCWWHQTCRFIISWCLSIANIKKFMNAEPLNYIVKNARCIQPARNIGVQRCLSNSQPHFVRPVLGQTPSASIAWRSTHVRANVGNFMLLGFPICRLVDIQFVLCLSCLSCCLSFFIAVPVTVWFCAMVCCCFLPRRDSLPKARKYWNWHIKALSIVYHVFDECVCVCHVLVMVVMLCWIVCHRDVCHVCHVLLCYILFVSFYIGNSKVKFRTNGNEKKTPKRQKRNKWTYHQDKSNGKDAQIQCILPLYEAPWTRSKKYQS